MVFPPELKITNLLKLVDYLLVQADRRGYTTVCQPELKKIHFCPRTGGHEWLYYGLPACTEDNPLAKTRGLSPRTGGQEWLYHGLPACTEDNLLAKTRGLSPRTGGQA